MPDDGSYYSASSTDCISSIASKHGFFWETIWFHPKNQQLRRVRKNPNVLRENDQIWIPALEIREESKPTDRRHTFVVKGIPTLFRMRFTDSSGQPRSNLAYILTIDGTNYNGRTDGDGKIEVNIQPDAQSGKLVLGEGKEAKTYELDLGALAPVSEPEGALKRLQSLGYHCGIDPQTGFSQALRSFQADQSLPTSGKLDTLTQNKLVDVFGC